MFRPTLIYCYDAYCGWCYGFSPVVRQLAAEYPDLWVEVLSGGMILPEQPVHISAFAGYIRGAYKEVEATTHVTFGQDYLWHILNPGESDWYPHSEKAAIALCVFKEQFPERQLEFAADLQHALHAEGRDLCDDETYRFLMGRYDLPAETFLSRLRDPAYRAFARESFDLVRQLGVTGYPALLLQPSERKIQYIAYGYAPFETVREALEQVLHNTSKG